MLNFNPNVPSIGIPSIAVKNLWGIEVDGASIGGIWFHPSNDNLSYHIVIRKKELGRLPTLEKAKDHVKTLLNL